MRTWSPIWSWRADWSHFSLPIIFGMYSRIQRCQNWLRINSDCFPLLLIKPSNASSQSGTRWGWVPPSIKWFGVKGSGSAGSVCTCVRGRLFNIEATSANTVRSTSSVTDQDWKHALRLCWNRSAVPIHHQYGIQRVETCASRYHGRWILLWRV